MLLLCLLLIGFQSLWYQQSLFLNDFSLRSLSHTAFIIKPADRLIFNCNRFFFVASSSHLVSSFIQQIMFAINYSISAFWFLLASCILFCVSFFLLRSCVDFSFSCSSLLDPLCITLNKFGADIDGIKSHIDFCRTTTQRIDRERQTSKRFYMK